MLWYFFATLQWKFTTEIMRIDHLGLLWARKSANMLPYLCEKFPRGMDIMAGW
jgi:hypothetical protein